MRSTSYSVPLGQPVVQALSAVPAGSHQQQQQQGAPHVAYAHATPVEVPSGSVMAVQAHTHSAMQPHYHSAHPTHHSHPSYSHHAAPATAAMPALTQTHIVQASPVKAMLATSVPVAAQAVPATAVAAHAHPHPHSHPAAIALPAQNPMLGRRHSSVHSTAGPGSTDKVVMAKVIDRAAGPANGSHPPHTAATAVTQAVVGTRAATAAAVAPAPATAWRPKQPVIAAILDESKAHAHLALPHAPVPPASHHTQGQAVPYTRPFMPNQRVVVATIVPTPANAAVVAHRNGVPTAAMVVATPVHALAVPAVARNRRRPSTGNAAAPSSAGKRPPGRGSGRAKLHAPDPLDQVGASDEGVTRCLCGDPSDDGFMICCESCGAWQHGDCVGLSEDGPVPDSYMCDLCDPDAPLHVRTREERARRQAELVAAGGGTLAADGKRVRRSRNRRRLTLGKKRRRGSTSSAAAAQQQYYAQGYSDGGEEEDYYYSEEGEEYEQGFSGSEAGGSRSGSHSMDESEDVPYATAGGGDDEEYVEEGNHSNGHMATAPPTHSHGTRGRKSLHVQTSVASGSSASRRSGTGSGGRHSHHQHHHHHRRSSRDHSHHSHHHHHHSSSHAYSHQPDPSPSPSDVAPSPNSEMILSPTSTAVAAALSGAAAAAAGGGVAGTNPPALPPSGATSADVTPAASPTGETKLRSLIFQVERLANGEMTSPIQTSSMAGGAVGPGGVRYAFPGGGATGSAGGPSSSAQATPTGSPTGASGSLFQGFPLMMRQVSENTANMALTLTSGFAAPSAPGATTNNGNGNVSAAGGGGESTAAAAPSWLGSSGSTSSGGKSTVVLEAFSPVLPQHLTSSGAAPLGSIDMELPPSAFSALPLGTLVPASSAPADDSNSPAIAPAAVPPGSASSPLMLENLLLSPNTSAAISTLTSVGRVMQLNTAAAKRQTPSPLPTPQPSPIATTEQQ